MNIAEEADQYFKSPPMLQTLASQEMALEILRFMIRNDVKDDHGGGWEISIVLDAFFFANKMMKGFPALLREMIKGRLCDQVVLSFEIWSIYHRRNVFYNSTSEYYYSALLRCIDEFVLRPDGAISFLQTAKRILNSDKFSELEKYKFACINCLVDDIERLWTSVSNSREVIIDERTPERSLLVYYWTNVMKGEFRRLPNDSQWLDNNVMNFLGNFEWTAIEYFWSFLCNDKQVFYALRLLSTYYQTEDFDFGQYYRLLSSMNDEPLRIVLQSIDVGVVIFSRLIQKSDEYWELILAIWDRLKNFISPDKFLGVIHSFITYHYMIYERPTRALYNDYVLFHVWISAPDQLKCYIRSNMEIIEGIFRALVPKGDLVRFGWHCFVDMKFFIALLTDLSFQSRNALWCEFWPNIIVRANLRSLGNIMRLCLKNNDEIIQFKECHMMNLSKIENFCCMFIEKFRVAKLNEFLNFCSSNGNLIAGLKRQLLQAPIIQSALIEKYMLNSSYSECYYIDIKNFIHSAFSNEEDAKNYERALGFSDEGDRYMRIRPTNPKLK